MFSSNKDVQNGGLEPEGSVSEGCSQRSVPLLVISLVGLLVAFLSGFHQSIPFLSSICTDACTDAGLMHFSHVHFWVWGALFYPVVGLLAFWKPKSVAWIAFAAAGAEAVLILIMIRLHLPCIFCIANAGVMVVLLGFAFRKKLIWQEATLALLFFVVFLFWVPLENNLHFFASANPGQFGLDYGPAATVDGEVITNQRLDVLLGSKLQQMRLDIYRMKMQRLDQLIVDRILAKEAKKHGKTVQDFTATLTSSAVVSDADVAQYIQQHQQQLQLYMKTVPDLKQRIKQGLEEQKRIQAVNDYAHAHEGRYDVRFFLPVPRPPEVKIHIGHAPSLGPRNAPVTVIEFSDYQCPACRANHPVVKQVRAAFGNKLRWVYKEYPLKIHPFAFKAAEAGLCANAQGKFWQYQDQLYTTPDLSVKNLIDMAAKLGMSREKFSKCLNDSQYKATVERSVSEAEQAGIDRTPTYVINGMVFIGGPSLDKFEKVISEALNEKGVKTDIGQKTK
jgi:protein-disulfide isomerase